MTRVLFVTKFAPTDRPSGGMIRTTRMIGALRQRFDVEVLGYVEVGEPAPAESGVVGREIVVEWDAPTRWSDMTRGGCVPRSARSWPPSAPTSFTSTTSIRRRWSGISACRRRWTCITSNRSSWQASAASSGGFTGLMARRDARLLKGVEQRAAERFQLVTAPSANEAARMPGNVEVVVNGVDPSREPLGVIPDPDLLCFVGIFSWLPNVDGAVWFVEKVLPLLPDRFRVQLVGRNPHRRVRALAGPRVEVTGEVADTLPYVSQGRRRPGAAPHARRNTIQDSRRAARRTVRRRDVTGG